MTTFYEVERLRHAANSVSPNIVVSGIQKLPLADSGISVYLATALFTPSLLGLAACSAEPGMSPIMPATTVAKNLMILNNLIHERIIAKSYKDVGFILLHV